MEKITPINKLGQGLAGLTLVVIIALTALSLIDGFYGMLTGKSFLLEPALAVADKILTFLFQ